MTPESSASEVTAYHFVDKVFNHPQGGADELLRLAEYSEREWIEFKAALQASPDQNQVKTFRKGAYAWNLLKAVVAMANSRGGIVILGLNDRAEPVSLEINDPRNFLLNEGPDAFLRKAIEPRLFPSSGNFQVSDGKRIHVDIKRLRDHVIPRFCSVKNAQCLAFLVKPVDQSKGPILVEESAPRREYILIRKAGDLGSQEELVTADERKRWAEFQVEKRSVFAGLTAKFFEEKGLPEESAKVFDAFVPRESLTIDPEISGRILQALQASPSGVTVHDLNEMDLGPSDIAEMQEYCSALAQRGQATLVKGHLWRLVGMFPAHPLSDSVADAMLPSAWKEFRQLCNYYIDCNLASGDKGVNVWPNSENQAFFQLTERLDWEELFQGEPVYMPDSALPDEFDKTKLLSENASFFLAGPAYVQQQRQPCLPVFINPCLLEWVREHEMIRITLTGPPELNDEWLSRVSKNPEDRQAFTDALSAYSAINEEQDTEWTPPRNLADLFVDLRKLIDKALIQEPLCLFSLAPLQPLEKIKTPGYYNRILVISQKSQVYTSRLQRELRKIAKADEDDLSKTALRWLFPNNAVHKSPAEKEPAAESSGSSPQLQTLSPDQSKACRLAGNNRLTVVTGPPGTGKSRVVANTMAQAFLNNNSVLFASRNHQAIDAVVPYLNQFNNNIPICGRMSMPYQQNAADPLREILGQLFNHTVAATAEAGQEAEQSFSELHVIMEHLEDKLGNLEKRAQEFDEADRKSGEAENMLADLGVDGNLVRQSASVIPQDGQANDLKNTLESLEEPGDGWLKCILEVLYQWKRKRAVKRAEPHLNRLREIFPSGPLSGEIAQLQNPASPLKASQAFATQLLRITNAARAVEGAREAKSVLDRHQALEDLEADIQQLQEQLCKKTVQALSSAANAAGRAIDGKEREAIDKMRATMEVGASGYRLQAMAIKYFPILLKYLPLWSVSNLSAGKYLPLSPGLFDLLIIDEASQCDIASVIPMMYRAKRVMVVGDRQQLRFVSGLSRSLNQRLRKRHQVEDNDTFDRLDYRVNSFFDLANGSSEADLEHRVLLRDHYRCHNRIADYFNRTFYNEALFINTDETSLKTVKGLPFGICWSQIEADARPAPGGGAISQGQIHAVCDELRRLQEAGFPGTVGVVTPFRSQANRILDAVMEAFHSNPPPHWDFQCSTADGFQGGERDIILFSLVGGPDMPRSCQWFYENDPNRFNVAVSRARTLLKIFGDRNWANTWARDLSSRNHIRRLAQYPLAEEMDQHALAHVQGEKPIIHGNPDRIGPVWEPKFAQALWEAGLPIQQQYPACGRYLDMALLAPGFKLGIEVDGEAWHRGPGGTRKKDDILRDTVLIANGWTIKRFWVYQLRDGFDQCVNEIAELWKQRPSKESDA